MTTKNSIEYDYNDPAYKHAVISLGTGENYTYDANGNMIMRVEGGLTYTQTFDAENRLVSVTVSGQTTQFLYDGDGNLVKKINPDGSRTLYVGGIYEVNKNSVGTVTGTKTYYPAAGAMRVNSTLYYTHKDHLGSTTAMTDASGGVVSEHGYYPFGQTRFTAGTMNTDKLYTGQREITGLGIYHYNARFYSPYINHFISADTIVPNPTNPQNLNRYSYVINNPLRYTDPTGHFCVEEDGDGNIIHVDCGSGMPPSTQHSPDEEDEDDPEELTDVQLVGQVITFFLIETTVLLPLDYGLLELTTEAAIACGTGVLLACAAEIPILAVDLVAADFQISLANTIAQNVATGERHEFESIIIPELISTIREPFE